MNSVLLAMSVHLGYTIMEAIDYLSVRRIILQVTRLWGGTYGVTATMRQCFGPVPRTIRPSEDRSLSSAPPTCPGTRRKRAIA